MRKIIHCSYHKNLTVYHGRVFRTFCRLTGRKYQHFDSLKARFEEEFDRLNIGSINNHYIEIDAYGPDVRVSRFVRDPRDMIVSGYFYHKRAAEAWCDIKGPRDHDWQVVNGKVPDAMPAELSYAEYLSGLDLEQGLLAEIEFRKHHFASMLQWPDDERILVLKYEDILGGEIEAFEQLSVHYGMNALERRLVRELAGRFRAPQSKMGKDTHVRDPKSGQWRDVFPEPVKRYFHQTYAALVDKYGYPVD